MQLLSLCLWSVFGLWTIFVRDGLAAPGLPSRDIISNLETRRIRSWQQHSVQPNSRSLALPLQPSNTTDTLNTLLGGEVTRWPIGRLGRRYVLIGEVKVRLPKERIKDLIEKALEKLDEESIIAMLQKEEYTWYKGKYMDSLELSVTPRRIKPVSPSTATTMLTVDDLVKTLQVIRNFYARGSQNEIQFELRAVERAGEDNALIASGHLSRSLTGSQNSTQLISADSSSSNSSIS